MTFCYSCMKQLEKETPVCPYCKSRVPYVPLHQEDLQPGTHLGEDGRFIIGRALGHGGYGITYIAYDTKMDVRRTIKEYFPKGAVRDYNLVPVYPESEAANVERTRAHFLHEARMMIRASEGHIPGIVQGIDQFQENGTSYILMEYLEGYTLDDYMHNVLYGPFQWDAAVHYATEALDSLQKLHEKNIIHRDISCNNIFLCTDNTIRLIDFGSAEPLDKAQTEPGSLWKSRKPAYTPREQAENREQGAYSDVYAMGVVLFKMITGNVDRQLNGRTLPSVRSAANNQEIPAALDKILMEATAEDPASRIQTAAEFRRKLLPLIGKKEGNGRKGLLLGILAVLVAVLALGAVLIFTSSGTQEESWAEIALSQTENEIRLNYGEVYQLTGSAQPGEAVKLVITIPGTDQQIADQTSLADSKGNWRIDYDTSKLPVELNGSGRYETHVEYEDQDHHRSSGFVYLTVSREFAALTLRFDNQNSGNLSVDHGAPVTIKGEGQPGQKILVSFSPRTENVQSFDKETECTDGTWTFTLNTNEIIFNPGEAERKYEITVRYNGFSSSSIKSLNLTVKRKFSAITASFADDSESMTVKETGKEILIFGKADPLENLTIKIGKQMTKTVQVDEEGKWETKIDSIDEIQGFETNNRIEFDVYARYNANTSILSNHLLLISDVQTGKTDHTPLISSSNPVTVTEGEDFQLEGTGDANATLTLLITRGNQSVVPDLKVMTQEDGSWKLKLNTKDIADEREEGRTTSYTAKVLFSFDQKKYQSNAITIIINTPKTYEIPTIGFTGYDEKNLTLRYTESAEMSGTARSGEHLRLIMNGQEQSYDIQTGADGRWSYRIGSLEAWKPAMDQTTELTFGIRYLAVEKASAEQLVLYVSNPKLEELTVSLKTDQEQTDGNSEPTIGMQGKAALTVHGSAGQNVELLRNNLVWNTLTLNEEGTASVSVTAEDIPSGTNQMALHFRYVQQRENRSADLILHVDRIAEAIQVTGEITEETVSISGTAEPGADLTLTINGTTNGSTKAGQDGAFRFDQLKLSAGDKITISETDIYGNTAAWNDQAKEVPRENIQLDQYGNNASINYGPDSATLVLSGTASANKTLTLIMQGDSSGEQDTHISVGKNGSWETEVSLPVLDKQQTDIQIQYEDKRGNKLMLHTWCDAKVEQPRLQPDTIYEHSPDSMTCVLSENDCTVHWALVSESGMIKAEETIPSVAAMQTVIELPSGRTAGDRIEVTVTDPYGNQASQSVTVKEQRDEISGAIQDVVDENENEIRDGSKFTGSLKVRAYAAAGYEANAETASVQIIQNGIPVTRVNLPAVTGEDLNWVAGRLSGHQADKGWRLKQGIIDVSQLEEGPCVLRLVAGDKELESWSLIYAKASAEGGTVMHVEDDGFGYDMGLDAPALSYSPKAICLSGWLYKYYEDTEMDIGSGHLTLYRDRMCTEMAATASSSKREFRKRLPGSTSCGADAKNLGMDAYENAGWIFLFKAIKAEDGLYWAKLEVDDIIFGPFELRIQNKNAQVKSLKDFVKNLSWNTED